MEYRRSGNFRRYNNSSVKFSSGFIFVAITTRRKLVHVEILYTYVNIIVITRKNFNIFCHVHTKNSYLSDEVEYGDISEGVLHQRVSHIQRALGCSG